MQVRIETPTEEKWISRGTNLLILSLNRDRFPQMEMRTRSVGGSVARKFRCYSRL